GHPVRRRRGGGPARDPRGGGPLRRRRSAARRRGRRPLRGRAVTAQAWVPARARPLVERVVDRREHVDRDAWWLVRLRVIVTGFALVYVVVRAPHLWSVAGLADSAPEGWDPVGPFVAWSEPWPSAARPAGRAMTVPVLARATVGAWWRWTGPLSPPGVQLLSMPPRTS